VPATYLPQYSELDSCRHGGARITQPGVLPEIASLARRLICGEGAPPPPDPRGRKRMVPAKSTKELQNKPGFRWPPAGLSGQIEFGVFPAQNRCFSLFSRQKHPISQTGGGGNRTRRSRVSETNKVPPTSPAAVARPGNERQRAWAPVAGVRMPRPWDTRPKLEKTARMQGSTKRGSWPRPDASEFPYGGVTVFWSSFGAMVRTSGPKRNAAGVAGVDQSTDVPGQARRSARISGGRGKGSSCPQLVLRRNWANLLPD